MHSLFNSPSNKIFINSAFYNLDREYPSREARLEIQSLDLFPPFSTFPWRKERRENPAAPSREDLRHISNSKQFCGSIRGKESERGEKTRLVDVIADKTASIFCRKVEIVPGTHGGIPAKTDNDRQHAANRAG